MPRRDDLVSETSAGAQTKAAAVAAWPGPILSIQARVPDGLAQGDLHGPIELVERVTTAINTTAGGGNASRMNIG